MTPKATKNLKHIAIKNGNLNYSSCLGWSHAICILRFRDHTSSRYRDSWKGNSTIQVRRTASFTKDGWVVGGGGEVKDGFDYQRWCSIQRWWAGGGGGEGRLDVTLVNSDASFRGWGKRLRTSMNIQEIYTWPRLFKRWIALSTG